MNLRAVWGVPIVTAAVPHGMTRRDAKKPKWPLVVALVVFILFGVAWLAYFIAFSHLAG